MYEFSYPWIFLLLPLPFLIWLLLRPYKEKIESIRVPFFEDLARAAALKPSPGAVILKTNWLQKILAPLAWILIVAAMAHPQYVEKPIEKIESARDLMLAIDISQSMEAKDFEDSSGQRINRLDAVKEVVNDFIEKRKGDRIGLIVFGGAAYPQVPFTLDHESCKILLDQTQIGMAGPQTMIGDAIGLAIKMFDHSKVKDRVLIILTDGNDTGSKMPPDKAAEIAKQRGIVIHTIGIGDPKARGEDKVDLDVMKKIASATGGQFFRGEDRVGLEKIYDTLDRITPQNFKRQTYKPIRPLFFWPLGAAVGVLLFFYVVMMLRSMFSRESSSENEVAMKKGA